MPSLPGPLDLHLSGFLTDVDGEGVTDQSGLSMAPRFLFAKHDLGRFDLLVSKEADCGSGVVAS